MALRQLASVLGARMIEEESDDVVAAIVDVAARRGSTYILVGRSRPARGLARLRVPLPQRLMERLPGCGRAHRRRPLESLERREAMSAASIFIIAAVAALLGIAAGYWLPPHGRRPSRDRPRPVRRILLPFTGQAISRRSFEAAVRLAKAENATVMPAFLARVPMNLPLESALPVQCAERHAAARGDRAATSAQGIPVDSRVGRGRSARDALRKLLEQEQFDRIIVSADEDPHVRAELRRPAMAARARPRGDPDSPPGSGGHAPDLGQRGRAGTSRRAAPPRPPAVRA